jgi:ribose transport system substrate-binding protein
VDQPHRSTIGSGKHRGWRLIRVALVGLVLAVTAACGAGDSSGTGDADGDPYKVVLSNNYVGNAFRVQMQNILSWYAETEHPDDVEFEIQNSELSVSAQIASLQQIILTQPDAILLEAASPTALNPTIQQACDAGILVYSFDQTATAECGYQLPYAYAKQAHDMATWMCAMNEGQSGEVIADLGLSGVPISDAFQENWKKTLEETCPELEIVATFESGSAQGRGLQALSSLLTTYPDVRGIFGMGYCSDQLTAMDTAGIAPVPQTCFGTNASAVACEEAAVPCFLWGAPAWVGAVALDNVVQVLNGEDVPKTAEAYDTNFIINSDVEFDAQQKVEVLEAGENYYPDESLDLVIPLSFDDVGITPTIALNGRP